LLGRHVAIAHKVGGVGLGHGFEFGEMLLHEVLAPRKCQRITKHTRRHRFETAGSDSHFTLVLSANRPPAELFDALSE
jgi:hypothetical protein